MSRKTVHKLLAVLLCVVLLCGVMGTASGSSNVYFMAVNDTVVEMTADNMPIVVGGTLYVPYIMLSAGTRASIWASPPSTAPPAARCLFPAGGWA